MYIPLENGIVQSYTEPSFFTFLNVKVILLPSPCNNTQGKTPRRLGAEFT